MTIVIRLDHVLDSPAKKSHVVGCDELLAPDSAILMMNVLFRIPGIHL